MGCCTSCQTAEVKANWQRHKEVQGDIDRQNMQDAMVLKLLLLGAGESGKSTIFKQVECVYKHNRKFDDKRLRAYTPIILQNVYQAMRTLLTQLEYSDLEVSPKVADSLAWFEEHILAPEDLCEEAIGHLDALWKDEMIQIIFQHRSKFQLIASAEYFLDKVDEILQPDYLPSQQDALRVRVRTTGIVESNFEIDSNLFRLIDVGGQRNERKKWIHCFEGVTAVLFVAAISEYDEVLYEDEDVNRMEEALNLFEEICNARWFLSTAMILFLNKRDLLKEKIKEVPLTVLWPEYCGGQSYDDAVAFMTEQFLMRNRTPGRTVYPHVTCATDTDNIAFVFEAVKDIVIRKTLDEAGLI